MTTTDQISSPKDESPPIADDAEVHRRFREAMDLFSAGMVAKAKEMKRRQDAEKTNSTEVREATALVIATQRIMEMTDHYEQKVRGDENADGSKRGQHRDWRAEAKKQLADIEDEVRRHIDALRPRENSDPEVHSS